nr:DUF4402 domain-containing protein [Salegentibacter tibetensis]
MFSCINHVYSQGQATANFTGSATIIQPIGITTTSNLNFASLDTRTGGDVILTPDNTRISSGGVELKDILNLSAATFEITGEQDFAFSISLSKNEYELTNGSHNMIIKNFTSSLAENNRLSTGKRVLRVGATLNVNPGQAPGLYNSMGEMAVTVNYN